MLRLCWIKVYAGAPDYIHTDAGTHFNSELFKKNANDLGTLVKIAPTEGHDANQVWKKLNIYMSCSGKR